MKFLKIVLLALLAPGFVSAQERKIVSLKQGSHPVVPTHYYVAVVIDQRADTNNVGIMRAGLTNRPVAVNLKGGAASSLAFYMVSAGKNHGDLQPVTFVIDELKVSEKGGALREEVVVEYDYSFMVNDAKLISYSGSGNVQTSSDASAYIEKIIRQSVDRTLGELDKQWSKLETSLKPARLDVAVTFAASSPGDPNLIAYSRDRPLNTGDFRGKADDLSAAAAATYCGLGITMSSQTGNGVMKVNVQLSVFADPERSWMRERAKNAYILDHEQRHFDLAAIAACRLRALILQQSFKAETLQEELMKLYHQVTDQLTKEQERYDQETVHSQHKEAQLKWKSNLESQLASQDCFK